jgi:hypothetical protein
MNSISKQMQPIKLMPNTNTKFKTKDAEMQLSDYKTPHPRKE